MAQFARPVADINNVGVWTTEPLWSKIDEGSAGGDTITSPNTAGAFCTLELGAVTDPAVSTGHVIRHHAGKVGTAGPAQAAITQLRQGYVDETTLGTLIATLTGTTQEGQMLTETYTLSGAEADAITDYSDLFVRLVCRAGEYDYVELEVPDASGGTSHEGAGASSVVVTTAGSGERTRLGAGASSVAVSTAASGQREATGSGSSTVVVTTSASGQKSAFGAGSTTVVVTTAASGTAAKFGAGASSVTVTTAGTGLRVAVGAGSTTVVVTTAASGRKEAFGAGSTTVVVTTSASGSTPTTHPPGPATAPLDTTGATSVDTTGARLAAELVTTGVSGSSVGTGMSTAPISDSSSEAE